MSKTALLINDSRFESLILKDLLMRLDFTVEIADEFDALYEMERLKPDLVVVNYIMQQTRGDKLIQLMKAGMPGLKCLLSSNSNIRKSDFPEDYIDGILHTPASQFMLESLLKGMGMDEEPKDEVLICSNCKRDLKEFPDVSFCPFCGIPLKKDN